MNSLLTLVALLGTPSALPIDGVALSLYYEAPAKGMRFDTMVDEIAALGATHISILVQWSQRDTKSSYLAPHPTATPADDLVARLIRRARSRGLAVMLFPIVWVEKTSIGDWRGTLKPRDEDGWWTAYIRFILHYADLAQREGAEILSIGSELASLEDRTDRWRDLARRVRARFAGKLIYSANWDHYATVTFWDAVDYLGLTGYYRLTQSHSPSLAELIEAWAKIRVVILEWQEEIGRPLIFTELGYPSIDGAAKSPWDYTTGRAIDHREQQDCYRAFVKVWGGERRLAGVFFWNWWGPSDGKNTWYTLKGKPALNEVKRWISEHRRQRNVQ